MDIMAHPIRKTIRLKGYDYARPGFYFVTICTHNREQLFGRIIVGADSISAQTGLADGTASSSARAELNDAGRMIDTIYNDMANEFRNIVLYEHVVMPNHLHGIVQICQPDRADMESAPTRSPYTSDRADMESAPTLARIVQTFKRITTIKYAEGVKNKVFEPFEYKVWQRGYYEHIIRNDMELTQIRQYIMNNPVKWLEDEYHT
jgi:REP element-mobilizing transposase RayT